MSDEQRRRQGEMEEQSAADIKRKKTRPRRKTHWFLKLLGALGTLILVGALTAGIFVWIFMNWVNTSLKGHVEVYIDEFENSVSTELYYQDVDSGEWIMYQTLFMQGEDRIWANLDEIPKNLRNAAVAIEDKRFYTHKGVDLRGTVRAILFTLGPGDSLQGGSTITQQLIKNLTEESETTVKRKITEIYRALEMETRYDKDEILEAYLNEIFLGRSCYGVEAASLRYFGKYVKELDLAECTSLIAVTNNPSMYGPLESDWTRKNNRSRQIDVLDCMLDQEMITQAEYNKAKAEEIVFTNGYTNMGNYVSDHLDEIGEEEVQAEQSASTAWNTYYTDAVIEDVAQALVKELGITENTYTDKDGIRHTESAFEQAVQMVYGNGYKIYTAQNIEYQKIVEHIFEDVTNAPYTTGDGEQLQGAMTVVDPYTGYVVAMVGGIGPKVADRGWNWATSVRPCGSAAKPISTYAPALDNGTITAASTIDDFPVMVLNGSPWPKNDHGGFRGLSTVRSAIVSSLNTCAVRVCMDYGVWNSYEYMTSKLGFTTLTSQDSQQVGNMALGGFQYGVTTEEMAAAYAAFVNEGIYTAPRTFVRVEDANGRVVLENEARSNVAMKPTTAAIMNSMLQQVITGGTGGSAHFSGMHIAGKTGTTNSQKDRYFVGYSPYYSAACWVGYKSNAVISSGGVNPAAVLWKQVMSEIHKDLPDKEFFSTSGLTTVTVCADSGMLATTACEEDPRGSRVRTEICAADNRPTEYCTMHTGFGTLNYVRDDEMFESFPNITAEDDEYVMHTAEYYYEPGEEGGDYAWMDWFRNLLGGRSWSDDDDGVYGRRPSGDDGTADGGTTTPDDGQPDTAGGEPDAGGDGE